MNGRLRDLQEANSLRTSTSLPSRAASRNMGSDPPQQKTRDFGVTRVPRIFEEQVLSPSDKRNNSAETSDVSSISRVSNGSTITSNGTLNPSNGESCKTTSSISISTHSTYSNRNGSTSEAVSEQIHRDNGLLRGHKLEYPTGMSGMISSADLYNRVISFICHSQWVSKWQELRRIHRGIERRTKAGSHEVVRGLLQSAQLSLIFEPPSEEELCTVAPPQNRV